MHCFVVLGTRPEAIKLAPVIQALRTIPTVRVTVCATGQHSHMLAQALSIFDIVADIDLAIMKPGQDLFDITINALSAIKPYLQNDAPDWVIVQGDTTSSFIGALAAFYCQIRVVHIEAGLRTWNKYAPFPEEINRVLVGHIADVHCAPTEISRQNLLQEGINPASIHVTGNTAIDALHWILHKIGHYSQQETQTLLSLPASVWQKAILDSTKKMIVVTGHRRENFGDGFENICHALARLAERDDVEIVYPVHLNPQVRKPVEAILSGKENVHLIEPLDYASFAYLQQQSYIIITDSGGVQEEAPSLGKPVLVLRDVTERPEAVTAGTVKLVGTNQERIVEEATLLLDSVEVYTAMAYAHNPYGDGKASARIVEHLLYNVQSNR